MWKITPIKKHSPQRTSPLLAKCLSCFTEKYGARAINAAPHGSGKYEKRRVAVRGLFVGRRHPCTAACLLFSPEEIAATLPIERKKSHAILCTQAENGNKKTHVIDTDRVRFLRVQAKACI